jgi:hypothetical protein
MLKIGSGNGRVNPIDDRKRDIYENFLLQGLFETGGQGKRKYSLNPPQGYPVGGVGTCFNGSMGISSPIIDD